MYLLGGECFLSYMQVSILVKLILWDTVGLLVNDNYSTPTVNNIYCSLSSCTGIDIQQVLERCALASQAVVH